MGKIKEIKDEFNEMIRNQKMEYHLSMAKAHGYKEKQR
jgi:hypothetical protein